MSSLIALGDACAENNFLKTIYLTDSFRSKKWIVDKLNVFSPVSSEYF